MFKFRLHGLLRYRKKQEEDKMREMALINSEVVAQNLKITGLQKSRKENISDFTSATARAKNINMLRLYQDYLAGCDQDILGTSNDMAKVNERLDKKREELVEFVRRRRALELLHDRQKKNYDLHMKRHEQKESDEIASHAFFREAI
jgi:flagellar export protein FliJ